MYIYIRQSADDLRRTDTNLDGAAVFNIRVLVGNRNDELLMLCARQMAEGLLNAGCSK